MSNQASGITLQGQNATSGSYDISTRLYETTLVGQFAGIGNNDYRNQVYGYSAGFSKKLGQDNSFFGAYSAYSNVNGNDSIVFGNYAGYQAVSLNSNMLIGNYAGYNIIDGLYNISIGNYSMYQNSYGNCNCIVGYGAFSNGQGNGNVGFGYNNMYLQQAGNCNTFTGFKSGYFNISGNYNTAYGANADVPSSNNIYCLAIGANVNTSGQYSISLGQNISNTSCNSSIVIGNYVSNTGCNVLLIMDNQIDQIQKGTAQSNVISNKWYCNSSDYYINIQNIIFGNPQTNQYTVSGNFSFLSNASFTQDVDFAKNVSIQSNLSVSNNVSVGNSLTVQSNIQTSNIISSNAQFSNLLSSNSQFSNIIANSGIFSNDLSSLGIFQVSGNTTLKSDLQVQGNTILTNLNTNTISNFGNVIIGDSLSVTSNIHTQTIQATTQLDTPLINSSNINSSNVTAQTGNFQNNYTSILNVSNNGYINQLSSTTFSNQCNAFIGDTLNVSNQINSCNINVSNKLITSNFLSSNANTSNLTVSEIATMNNAYISNGTYFNLNGSNLQSSNINSSNFYGYNYYGSNFYGSNFWGTNVSTCNAYFEQTNTDKLFSSNIENKCNINTNTINIYSNLVSSNANFSNISSCNGQISSLTVLSDLHSAGYSYFSNSAQFQDVIVNGVLYMSNSNSNIGTSSDNLALSNLVVTSNTQLNYLTVSNDAILNSNLSVKCNTSTCNLQVSNYATFNNAFFSNQVTFNNFATFNNAAFNNASFLNFTSINSIQSNSSLYLSKLYSPKIYGRIFFYPYNYLQTPGGNSNVWSFGHQQIGQDTKKTDLIIASESGAIIRFSDNFVPSVLSFTAQHQVSFSGIASNYKKGFIVVSTGYLQNLFDKDPFLFQDQIDDFSEALPVCELSSNENDPRVIGVVNKLSKYNKDSGYSFGIGHIQMKTKQKMQTQKIEINSGGLGYICVHYILGFYYQNGDLITTSNKLGLGQKQQESCVFNYTVCKLIQDQQLNQPIFNFNGNYYVIMACQYCM